MRAGLSTILQTLTPEAANVLNHSIAEAGRRNHNQTTPLHVAATLLAAPTGFLRHACIRSHPNSSHPLQCRALELCFSVALERLPSATSSPAVTEPPVSNALMAALKRAQAHQRRGCPEQQQQPLLAVKVELEQFIISILDDPSVSRVMREASFSSPAVKATIEQSLNNNNNVSGGNHFNHSTLGVGFRPTPSPATQIPIPINRNLYLNPRLQQQRQTNLSLNQSGQQRIDDVKRVIEIMLKSKKNNPILVGEFEPESIKKEILMRIQKGEFKNAEVISIETELEFQSDKSQFPAKIKKLSDFIETRTQSSDDGGGNRSFIIDLGDLKWLVEQPPTAVVSDIGRESVSEMSKLMAKFTAENSKIWLIGTATCETYLRCQVYHPSMETDWDLQAVPISTGSPLNGSITTNGIFGTSFESLNSFKNIPTTMLNRHPYENLDSAQNPSCCPKCWHDYEQELTKLNELEKSKPSVECKSNLPQWLQNAKAQSDETETKSPHLSRNNNQELQKKWSDICSRIHYQIPRLTRMATGFVDQSPFLSTCKPNWLLCQSQTAQSPEAPRSPVLTELVLGQKEVHDESPVKDLLGCISSEPRLKFNGYPKGNFVNAADADSFKKLHKGLMKKVWWQPEAASAIATTLTQCGSKGSVWLLFAGPDRVGKKKMATVLADHVCAAGPITVCLGWNREEDEMGFGFRGKTVLDRIVEAVRRNPFSVIVLSDIDEADTVVRGSIKRAMERGRFTDSHGREISLGNIIFVLTGNWSGNNLIEHMLDEKRLNSAAAGDWRLKLTVCEKRPKRRADWLPEEDRTETKQQKKAGYGLSLDLNLAVDSEEDRTDGSDLTIEQGDENPYFPVTSVPHELVGSSDAAVVFKPVRFGVIRREIEKIIRNAFSAIVDEKLSMEVDEATLENILGGLWFGQTGLEEWAEQVLVPSFHKLAAELSSSCRDMVVRLESDRGSGEVIHGGDWLPGEINVIVDTA